MNPFDLAGPEFLLFYLVLLIVAHLAYQPILHALLGDAASKYERPSGFELANLDPYLIAYLRGREAETARVAIVSLVDRLLLKIEGDSLQALPDAEDKVSRPLERQLLRFFASKKKASLIYTHSKFNASCADLREELVSRGLTLSTEQANPASLLRFVLIVGMIAVSIAKIVSALERGHYNIGFLIVLTVIATLSFFLRKSVVRTEKGAFALRELQAQFARLRDRSEQIPLGGASRELILLTAVFGVTALPTAALAGVEPLFPAQFSPSSSSGSSCGGTSCSGSSSCGSSSGSSCGGGGCGGCGGGGCG